MGICKRNSPIRNVKISPIKFNESILNKKQLSYQASDFLPETEISPSRSEKKTGQKG